MKARRTDDVIAPTRVSGAGGLCHTAGRQPREYGMSLDLLADLVLLLHLTVVLFVVMGLPAVVIGHRRGWLWVNRLGWRLAHLVAIGVVVLQAWLDRYCPLTVLESSLRARAGQPIYERSFMAHWAQALLYYDAPLWVFATIYTLFGAGVVWAWFAYPPQSAARPLP